MTEDECKAHALRIAAGALRDLEYWPVYEDQALAEVSEDDKVFIHRIITNLVSRAIRTLPLEG